MKCACVLYSVVPDSSTPWTVACQAPLFMGFFRQKYWTGLPFSPPRDFSDLGINLCLLASSALAGRFFTTELSGKPKVNEQTETNIYMPLCFKLKLNSY